MTTTGSSVNHLVAMLQVNVKKISLKKTIYNICPEEQQVLWKLSGSSATVRAVQCIY